MPLIETLAIEVGSSIAKSLLKLWLKDSDIALDASSSIVNLLSSRTADRIAQQRAERQFKQIGEKIGENLLPIFEIEGLNLGENSRLSVALAVAETLDLATSEILAQNDLQPAKLAKFLLTNSVATQYFNETEKSLFERLISEVCEDIVEIASRLPSFTERTFSEVLKREGLLLDITMKTLDEIQILREQLNPMEQASRFELEYRRAIIRSLDVLELFGTDVSDASRRHSLTVAYVTLAVAEASLNDLGKKAEESDLSNTLFGEMENEADRSIMSVTEALAESHRLLIRGFAGSGKTTLLQWIAVRSASHSFDKALSSWNDTIPFYIRLRHHAHLELPAPEAFPKLITSAMIDTMPKGWVHTQLMKGRAVVLIDGLDEIPETRRRDVQIWLKELVETFPSVRFIVTSRPHAVREGWMSQEGFSDAELQPMELPDIYSFIDHWHEAVAKELQQIQEKSQLISLAKHLKDDLEQNKSLRNLVTSPLLCAMLCALNRDRRQQLPSDRIELYEACCSMLLGRRDWDQGIDLSTYPASTLNYRQKRVLLEDIAYWMIKNGWSEVELRLVEDRLARKLPNLQDVSKNITSSDIRKFFIERTGLLREPVVGRVDFTHRTFEEYLAAKAASDEIDIGVLVSNAHNDLWREVIILASGLAAKPMRERLLQELIARGDKESVHRHQLYLLAVACLETSVELEQNVKDELLKRLNELIPPKSMTDAKSLAMAGDLAVPYLTLRYLIARKLVPITIMAACVRTLALIHTDTALKALEDYAADGSVKVNEELFKAWSSFNHEVYAKRVLQPVVQRQFYLRLPHLLSLKELESLEYLGYVDTLNVISSKPIEYLSNLKYMKYLTDLTLEHCEQLEDLNTLASLTELTNLSLGLCKRLKDLSPLLSLKFLEHLKLDHCEQINNLNLLVNLNHLISLELANHDLEDLNSLANLTQLTNLRLFVNGKLRDLSPLNNLKQLKSLSLSFCDKLDGLSPLSNMTQLVELHLVSLKQIKDLSPLENLSQLRKLTLAYMHPLPDLQCLKKLDQLQVITN